MYRAVTLLSLLCLAAACSRTTGEWPGSLEALLASRPDRFGEILADPAGYRVQIIYTQIDRGPDNRPKFRTFRYRVDPAEYFYPASTVKLPVAVLALEKLKRLGIRRDATMLTGSAADFQRAVTTDETAPDGLPSVGHYVRKIFLVSDNAAFNRLYEFVGQEAINETLAARGYDGARIVHRLESDLGVDQQRHTNPVRFVAGGQTLYEQEAAYSHVSYIGVSPEPLGVAEIVAGLRVDGPKDFAEKNALPLEAQHDLLLALLFPEAVPPDRRFDLAAGDYRFLYCAMSMLPGESGLAAYSDPAEYPAGFVKFLLYGGDAQAIPGHIRIFNKVGDAYGFLTDTAYIADFENGVEFLLAATVYVNANQTFNDGEYEYEELGLPFLERLGRSIYDVELTRERERVPDLSRFRGSFCGP